MAISQNAGFSARGGAALPTDLGQALAVQLTRWFDVFRRPEAQLSNDSLAGPSFAALTPDLLNETRRL